MPVLTLRIDDQIFLKNDLRWPGLKICIANNYHVQRKELSFLFKTSSFVNVRVVRYYCRTHILKQLTMYLCIFGLNFSVHRLEEDTAKMASLSLLLIVFALLRVAFSHGHRNQTRKKWDP